MLLDDKKKQQPIFCQLTTRNKHENYRVDLNRMLRRRDSFAQVNDVSNIIFRHQRDTNRTSKTDRLCVKKIGGRKGGGKFTSLLDKMITGKISRTF